MSVPINATIEWAIMKPDERKKKRQCAVCGSNLSVRYKIKVAFNSSDDKKVTVGMPLCNTCVFLFMK